MARVGAAFPSWQSHVTAKGRKASKALGLREFRILRLLSLLSRVTVSGRPQRPELQANGVASGDPKAICSGMPDRFEVHALVWDTTVNRVCMMCGSLT
jgi:hypothetical protein